MLSKKKTINKLPTALKDTLLLRNILLKRGNRERAFRFMSEVHGIIKTSYRKNRLKPKVKVKIKTKIKFNKKNRTKKRIKIKTVETIRPKPYLVVNEALYKIKPGFILRRLIRAGKTYKIPVPISDHRATYLACKWLKQATVEDTKTSITIPHLIFRELRDLLRNKGKAIKSLRTYISTAIDQRPFTKFLRKVGDTRPKKKKKKKGKSMEYLKNPSQFRNTISEAREDMYKRLNRRLRRRLNRKTRKQAKRILFTKQVLRKRVYRKNVRIAKVKRHLQKLLKRQKRFKKRGIKNPYSAALDAKLKRYSGILKQKPTKKKNNKNVTNVKKNRSYTNTKT